MITYIIIVLFLFTSNSNLPSVFLSRGLWDTWGQHRRHHGPQDGPGMFLGPCARSWDPGGRSWDPFGCPWDPCLFSGIIGGLLEAMALQHLRNRLHVQNGASEHVNGQAWSQLTRHLNASPFPLQFFSSTLPDPPPKKCAPSKLNLFLQPPSRSAPTYVY